MKCGCSHSCCGATYCDAHLAKAQNDHRESADNVIRTLALELYKRGIKVERVTVSLATSRPEKVLPSETISAPSGSIEIEYRPS